MAQNLDLLERVDDPNVIFRSRPKVVDDRSPARGSVLQQAGGEEEAMLSRSMRVLNATYNSRIAASSPPVALAQTPTPRTTTTRRYPQSPATPSPAVGSRGVISSLAELAAFSAKRPTDVLDPWQAASTTPASAVRPTVSTAAAEAYRQPPTPTPRKLQATSLMFPIATGSVISPSPAPPSNTPNATSTDLLALKDAFAHLQSQVREMKHFFRKLLELEVRKMERAAVRIQAWWRGEYVRKRFVEFNKRKLRNEQRSVSSCVSNNRVMSSINAFSSSVHEQEEAMRRQMTDADVAAARIQAFIRGVRARREIQQQRQTALAARRILTFWRNYKRRKQFQLTRADFLRALQIQNEKIELSEQKVRLLKQEVEQERQLRKQLESQVMQLLQRFEQLSTDKAKPLPPIVDKASPEKTDQ